MIYREDRITKQLFRRAGNGSEEYIARKREWEITDDAIRAFYDSSDTQRITEKEAIKNMELQNALVEKEWCFISIEIKANLTQEQLKKMTRNIMEVAGIKAYEYAVERTPARGESRYSTGQLRESIRMEMVFMRKS